MGPKTIIFPKGLVLLKIKKTKKKRSILHSLNSDLHLGSPKDFYKLRNKYN